MVNPGRGLFELAFCQASFRFRPEVESQTPGGLSTLLCDYLLSGSFGWRVVVIFVPQRPLFPPLPTSMVRLVLAMVISIPLPETVIGSHRDAETSNGLPAKSRGPRCRAWGLVWRAGRPGPCVWSAMAANKAVPLTGTNVSMSKDVETSGGFHAFGMRAVREAVSVQLLWRVTGRCGGPTNSNALPWTGHKYFHSIDGNGHVHAWRRGNERWFEWRCRCPSTGSM